MAATSLDEFVAIDVPDAGFRDARFRAHIIGVSALLMHSSAGMRAPGDEIKRSGKSTVPPDVEADALDLGNDRLVAELQHLRDLLNNLSLPGLEAAS